MLSVLRLAEVEIHVFQLETAMGSAITNFHHACAVVVPRKRFAPVKTTADLLQVMSDCFIRTDKDTIAPNPERTPRHRIEDAAAAEDAQSRLLPADLFAEQGAGKAQDDARQADDVRNNLVMEVDKGFATNPII